MSMSNTDQAARWADLIAQFVVDQDEAALATGLQSLFTDTNSQIPALGDKMDAVIAIKEDILSSVEAGLNVKGTIDAISDLEAIEAADGDGYQLVNAADPLDGHLFRWVAGAWVDTGPYRGGRGASAYDVAVANGYEGTEEEYAQDPINKAILAETAAGNADEKADLADAKAVFAQDRGDYAQAKGDYALEQGEAAAGVVAGASTILEAVPLAETARDAAIEAAQEAAAVVPSVLQTTDEAFALALLDPLGGKQLPLVRADGRVLQIDPTSTAPYETVPLRREVVPAPTVALISDLVGGETPTEIELDETTGIVVRVTTKQGGLWLLNHATGVLERANKVDLTAALAAQAAAEAAAGEAADAADAAADVVPSVLQTTDEAFALALIDPVAGRQLPMVRTDGRLVQIDPTSVAPYETVPLRREVAEAPTTTLLGPIVGTETPVEIERDTTTGVIVKAVTKEGGLWLLNHTTGALVKVGTDATAAGGASYTALAWTSGAGQTTRLHYFSSSYLTAHPVCLILPTIGQSNAIGQNTSSDTILGASAVYSGKALMFTGGPRRQGAGITTTVDLVESGNGSQRETAASGWANHLIRDINAATGIQPRTLSFVCGIGGMPYMALKRGQTNYASFLAAIDDAVTVCKAQGWTPIVPAIDWMQGESDSDLVVGMTVTQRMRQMQQLARQLRADVVVRTGQSEPPVLLITQTGYTPNNGDLWEQPVRRAAVLLDGVDGIRLVGPVYQHPYNDVIHLSSLGQNRRGQALARATVEEIFGTGWRPMRPVDWYWNSTIELRLVFDKAVTIDTSGTFITTSGLTTQGLNFDDGSGSPPAISNVTGSGSEIIVTLSAAPTGPRPRISYAARRSSGNTTQDGPVTGARGTLRGTAAHTSLYDSVDNYDWAPSFTLALFKP